MTFLRKILLLSFILLPSVRSPAAVYKVAGEKSLFGAVVYKSGIGSALAHNHLVFSRSLRVTQL